LNMPLPLADSTDVSATWRPLTDSEALAVDGLIRFASAIVRRQVPSVDVRLAAGTLDSDLVRGVIASMVQRALVNPDRNRVVGVDDMRMEKDPSAASGELYLTDAELALLRPISLVGSTTNQAFNVRTPAAPFRSPGWFPGWFGEPGPGPWENQGFPAAFPWGY
jgi:hypothetical protein